MTNRSRKCSCCDLRTGMQASPCKKCGQLPSPQSEKRDTFTRRNVLIVGGACLVGLLGIEVGVVGCSLLPSAQSVSQDAPTAVNGLQWSPDGTSIASYNNAGDIQIWEAPSGKLKYTFANNGSITRLAWSHDSTMLAVGTFSMDTSGGEENNTSDGSVRILNSNTGARQHSLQITASTDGFLPSSNYVAWSPDGQYIAAADASTNGNIGMWSTKNWRAVPLKPLPGQFVEPRGLGWSPNSQKLLFTFDTVSPSNNQKMLGMILVWDMHAQQAELTKQVGIGDGDGSLLDSGKGVELNIGGASWSPDGEMFAIGLNQQVLVFNSAGQLRGKHGVFSNYGMAPTLAWSPTNPQRLAGQFAADPNVYVWNPSTNQLIQKYTHAADTTDIAFSWSPDGKYLASTDGNTIQIGSAK